MANRCTRIPEIMFPREGVDLSKWAVIACDQYTSQPDYWAETDKTVGDAPSTLRLTLPEVYLEDADVAARTEKIHQTMQQYVQDGTLRTLPAGVVLTERWSGGSCPRRGIVCRSIWKRMNTRPVPHPSSARPKRRLSSVFRPVSRFVRVRAWSCRTL